MKYFDLTVLPTQHFSSQAWILDGTREGIKEHKLNRGKHITNHTIAAQLRFDSRKQLLESPSSPMASVMKALSSGWSLHWAHLISSFWRLLSKGVLLSGPQKSLEMWIFLLIWERNCWFSPMRWSGSCRSLNGCKPHAQVPTSAVPERFPSWYPPLAPLLPSPAYTASFSVNGFWAVRIPKL